MFTQTRWGVALLVSPSVCGQQGTEALEGVDQPGAATAPDLARDTIDVLLPQRWFLAEVLSVGLVDQYPGRAVRGPQQRILEHLQPGIAERRRSSPVTRLQVTVLGSAAASLPAAHTDMEAEPRLSRREGLRADQSFSWEGKEWRRWLRFRPSV